jgi:hypothetical protein
VKVREITTLIEADVTDNIGMRPSLVVLRLGKPSDDLAPRTLNSILKQAGLKETK